MKTLFVLRHAKSSWEDDVSDHDRTLTERGKRDAVAVGKLLGEREPKPESVLCSTAKRARKTAERVVKHAHLELEIRFLPQLYLAPVSTIEFVLREHGKTACVLLVGHNPGLEEFISRSKGSRLAMPTAAIAQLEFQINEWGEFLLTQPARLVEFWQPKELD